MRRGAGGGIVVVVAGLLVALGARPSPAQDVPIDGLVVHEWGVLVTDPALDRTEPPPAFVHRVAGDGPFAPPGPGDGPPFGGEERKPVIYFYRGARFPEAIALDVRLPAGSFGRSIYYPAADVLPNRPEPGGGDSGGTLRFTLALPSMPFGGSLRADVPAWWAAARVHDAAIVTAPLEAEGFVFYEAPLAPPAGPTVTEERFSTALMHRVTGGSVAVRDVLAIDRRGDRVSYGVADAVGPGEQAYLSWRTETPDGFRQELHRRLVGAGLFAAEADAFLRVWGDSLLGDTPLLFYRLDLGAADRMVPLAITPAPSRVVRVWWVASPLPLLREQIPEAAFAERRPGTFAVHEWGVVTTDDSLDPTPAAPGFVHTVPAQGAPPPDVPAPRKPIAYFYPATPAPTDLTVRIGLPAASLPGTIHWPGGTPIRDGPSAAGLGFSLRMNAGGTPPAAPAWWEACRVPDAALLSTRDGREAERFLFYETRLPIAATPSIQYVFGHHGPRVEVRGGSLPVEDVVAVWREADGLIMCGDLDALGAGEGGVLTLHVASEAMVRDILRARLARTGLYRAEAEALLSVWGPSLDGDPPIVLCRLAAADVDRLVPLEITPPPAERVRVWLVAARIPDGWRR